MAALRRWRHGGAAWLAVALVLAAALLLFGCAAAPPPAPSSAPLPEGASGLQPKAEAGPGAFMVAAAHPLAAEAGAAILRRGGSAADAAIAVQLVLTLVEPQSSGIGGGAFALTWDGRQVQAWDGRETAPAAADERLFLSADGTPLPYRQAAVGGLAVGVPGVMRLLEALHRAQGQLPWAELFAPAIALAEQGFEVGARMHALLQAETALRADPRAAAYFYRADGSAPPVGHRLRNPALAAVLRRLAAEGADAFYRGPIAADLVHRVQLAAPPGRLQASDLAHYAVVPRTPLCADWRERWRICGMPPPSSGQIAILQILGLVDAAAPPAPALADGVPSSGWLHVYAEAARLAFADRACYVGDPAFVPAPGGDWRTLLAPAYLRARAGLIGPKAMPSAPPGEPAPLREPLGVAAPQPEAGTSHVSIVDAQGRAVALTTSIQTAWGSRLLADGGTGLPGGYLLNNQLTDFAFAPIDAAGRPLANRVQPRKRPRSSMSPTLVFDRDDGGLRLVAGSSLGAMIIHSTAKALLGVLGWQLGLQPAAELPNFGVIDAPLLLERGRFPAATAAALRALGHPVVEVELPTGAQLVGRVPGGWGGAADPRREGVAIGR